MAIIKCKMCGGDIELSPDRTFGTCDSCGSTMTLPKIDDDQRAAAFNRGNHFRRIGEFDKALTVYERIVEEDETDAEAHWCCALCRFGIEYVEDPATGEWLPTCHRASFDSFLEDVDYLAALQYSDGVTRRQYQRDAAKIAEVQRGILATSQNEEPFDVFICYTVVATKYTKDDYDGQCDVEGWKDIVAISAGSFHTVGLRADGTVIAAGDNYFGQSNVSGWTDIVAVSAGWRHTVGLKADGTVIAVGDDEDGRCDVEGWTDIVAVSAGDNHTVGLKADGTVVIVGYNYDDRYDMKSWTDIVAISAGSVYTVGLKADGTAVAAGYDFHGQCDVENWSNIVAVSAGERCAMGLKADGIVITAGDDYFGQSGISNWTNIKLPY